MPNGNGLSTPDKKPPPPNGGNGNGLTAHRLSELERRMATLELTTTSINNTVIEIKTTLNEVANKSYVLRYFAGTGAVAILTILAHIGLRLIK